MAVATAIIPPLEEVFFGIEEPANEVGPVCKIYETYIYLVRSDEIWSDQSLRCPLSDPLRCPA